MRLPNVSPRKVVRALQKVGFLEMRQTGSHLILAHKTTKKIVPIPTHSGDIKRGLLFSIIKQSGLTADEFVKLL